MKCFLCDSFSSAFTGRPTVGTLQPPHRSAWVYLPCTQHTVVHFRMVFFLSASCHACLCSTAALTLRLRSLLPPPQVFPLRCAPLPLPAPTGIGERSPTAGGRWPPTREKRARVAALSRRRSSVPAGEGARPRRGGAEGPGGRGPSPQSRLRGGGENHGASPLSGPAHLEIGGPAMLQASRRRRDGGGGRG